jgi:hypothetical protein
MPIASLITRSTRAKTRGGMVTLISLAVLSLKNAVDLARHAAGLP